MDNMINADFKRKLPIPKDIKEQYPLAPEAVAVKEKRDAELADIFRGRDDRFVLVIGPCSADRADAVLEYIHRLSEVQKEVEDKIFIVPRIWLIAIRELHKAAIEQTGMTCADEMLYPENTRYLSDLLSYIAVGARSVENQEHRLTASSMNIPVGMKNPTSGDFSIMLNAIKAAQGSHMFIHRGWEVESHGNELAHAILRGSVDKHGVNHQNYHYEDLRILHDMYCTEGFKNPAVIVDTNHSNSGKRYLEQIRIANEVLHSMRHSEDIKKLVKGFMIESYLVDGCQSIDDGVYGKSITDPCLGWDKTKELIYMIAEQL